MTGSTTLDPGERNTRAGLALVTLAALLNGCAGWPSSVEDADLPDSQVGGYCIGNVASVADIKAPAGVVIEVRAAKDKLNRTILLDISILTPRGVTIRLQPPEMVLHSPEWQADKRLVIRHFAARGGSHFPATATLAGATDGPPSVFSPWYFATSETELPQTAIRQVKEFTLKLPVFVINGRDFRPEPITFRSYRELGLFGCR